MTQLTHSTICIKLLIIISSLIKYIEAPPSRVHNGLPNSKLAPLGINSESQCTKGIYLCLLQWVNCNNIVSFVSL